VSAAPLVIVNPVAGRGRGAVVGVRLADVLAGRDAPEMRWTDGPGHAEELARAAARDGRQRVIAVGGDGTLQEVVNGMLSAGNAGGGPILGILPTGRGNDLARSLGLPRSQAHAWRLASTAAPEPVDVLRATASDGVARWFVSAGGAGFDAQVARAMAGRTGWAGGQLGYLATTLRELRRFDNRGVRITIDGTPTISRRALFVAIANGEYYGGGMRIAPGAVVGDGEMDVCIVGDISRLEVIRWLPRLYRGTHVAHPKVELLRGRTLRLEADEPTCVHLDGEPFRDLPLTITVEAAALRVAGAASRPTSTGYPAPS
jgi:diacylglycerol kinase (ATP)